MICFYVVGQWSAKSCYESGILKVLKSCCLILFLYILSVFIISITNKKTKSCGVPDQCHKIYFLIVILYFMQTNKHMHKRMGKKWLVGYPV